MEVLVTRAESSDELQHHGIKGQRWGRRLYQNKDGSLTALGKKRYNKEVENLKKEKAKVKEAEKVAANKKKTQAKLDKLDAEKKKLEERKKALKEDSSKKSDDAKKDGEESPEERKARVLKSTDPTEIYKNRDILTYNELNERVMRIDLEARLQGKIPAEPDRVNDVKNAINKATDLYKSVDNAYSTLINSAIGKSLAKALDLDLGDDKNKRVTLDEILKNPNKYDAKKIQEATQAETNLKKLRDLQKGYEKEAKKEAEERAKAAETEKKKSDAENLKKAQEQVNDYNKKTRPDPEPDTTYREQYRKATKDTSSNRLGIEQIDKAPTDGKIYGKGTSTSSIKEQMDNGKKWWDTGNVADTVDFSTESTGRNYVALLEDRSRGD